METGSARIDRLVIHKVGNKIREEGITLSIVEPFIPQEVSSIILKDFLGGIAKSGNSYAFFHESDLNMNEMYAFSNEIFINEDEFLKTSEKIAKHLYSKSTHPNIAGGELLIALFKDIGEDGKEKRGIGLFKIEKKELFLSIAGNKGNFSIHESEGINPKDIQKAALIFERNEGVIALERGNTKTAYWIDEFLKLRPNATPKGLAAYVHNIAKKTISQITDLPVIEDYRKKVDTLLESEDPTLAEFTKISELFIGAENSEPILNTLKENSGIDFPKDSSLPKKIVTKQLKAAFRRINIADGIDIVFSGKIQNKILRNEISKDNKTLEITIEIGVQK